MIRDAETSLNVLKIDGAELRELDIRTGVFRPLFCFQGATTP
jgi:hypothetical protein